ncbi:MAG: MFS transporter [Bacteroidetes bacterium]|nr:MFS transporter [Bacteroidota bacterium]
MNNNLHKSPFNLAVIVAGLGFFVDAFDLFLFNIYRVPSLKEMGFSGTQLSHQGEFLLAIQMAGMMVGGILTGIIGDKKGRKTVLFGSILLYSLSNIANAFVDDTTCYAIIRFLAGVGLAGELGAGITIVSESMTIKNRGYGTILVATLGALGAVTAGLIGNIIPWRIAFFIAGCMGLLLLLLRMKISEPIMFQEQQQLANQKRFI